MKTLILISLLLCGNLTAENVKVHTHSYPKTDTVFETSWDLQGTAHFKFKRIFSVLTGAYYQQQDGDGERLVFTYTRNIKAEDLVSSSTEHLQENASPELLDFYAELLAEIQGAYTNLEKNDSYAITILPDRGIWLVRDGEVVFQSDNAEFGDWYLDIWLGDPPIDARLKRKLLGD